MFGGRLQLSISFQYISDAIVTRAHLIVVFFSTLFATE